MIDYDNDFDKVRGNNEIILIVEDEKALRDAIKELLIESGYLVITAAGFQEALQVFNAEKNVRVVLSDLSLSGANGIDLLERMNQKRPGVKVILASGFVESDQRDKMAHKGIDLFLQKPYTPIELLTIVSQALSGA